jgi:hypothetical protein
MKMATTVRSWIADLLGTPTCLCGAKMGLTRIEPHPTIPDFELRTYECRECNDTVVQNVAIAREGAMNAAISKRSLRR